jgi:hypothetical protein
MKVIAAEILKMAKLVLSPKNEMGMDAMSLSVAKYLADNPNPADAKFHAWADEQKIEHAVAEAGAYRLATMFVAFLFSGRANKEGVGIDDVDPVELALGITVEMEHTDNMLIAMRIALDHLAEIKDYYTRLLEMEKEAGVKD